ncbi:MAG TPA: L-serine ammonia-lyase, iron-sulfur-dependent, subunit beta [Clostridiaceae bacterium]|nr:L-serine ammonia-lyase, iron-sulfur-dependent, subunit beta [Clostridiaceae bacterium]
MAVFQSVFDIIGPVMVGPSSSHTAGAVRIGLAARSIFGEQPEEVDITLYGSFGHTYRGHGTDLALIGGLLGRATDSDEIRYAYDLAEKEGLKVNIKVSDRNVDHPNTAHIVMFAGDRSMNMTACSVGGGMINIIRIDGFRVRVSFDNPTVLFFYRDRTGMIARVTRILADHSINVSRMQVARKESGTQALMTIATDGIIPERVMAEIRSISELGPIISLSELMREPDQAPVNGSTAQESRRPQS